MFEELGYYKEFWVKRKYIGSIKCERDRKEIGYNGQQDEVLSQDVVCMNKKKIKQGTLVTTMIYPLNGKKL